MNETVPEDGWKPKRDSFTKMKTYFTDGNKALWYSWDWKNRRSRKRDRQLGLQRHRARIAKFGQNCRTALIYDMASERLIEKYRYGKRVPTDPDDTGDRVSDAQFKTPE